MNIYGHLILNQRNFCNLCTERKKNLIQVIIFFISLNTQNKSFLSEMQLIVFILRKLSLHFNNKFLEASITQGKQIFLQFK